jgi:hypothetical protein
MPSLVPITAFARSGRRLPGRTWLPPNLPAVSSPFTQGSIAEVYPPRYLGGQAYVSWQSTGPPGSWFQVYIDGVLAWAGQTTSVTLPVPPYVVRIDIGSVPAGDEWTSFASALPPAPKRRATLSWSGGRFEAADLAGFSVYQSRAANQPVSFAAPVAVITAYPSSIYTDGFGMGGFSSGAFGSSAGTYTYTSSAMNSGSWSFTVQPFDMAGNQGSAQTAQMTIQVPPGTPPVITGMTRRLNYCYLIASHEATLSWNPSPP